MEQSIQDFEKFIEEVYSSWKRIDLEYLEKQREELEKHRPLPEVVLKSLEEKLEIDEVHNSTAIEGNTLTLGETALVLTKGLTIGGKTLKDHLEVKSYDKAYQYIKSIYKKIEKIDEKIILEIHRLVFSDFTDELKAQLNPVRDSENQEGVQNKHISNGVNHGIGIYRRQPVFIRGSTFVPPNYRKVPELMDSLIDFLNSIKDDELRKSILAHLGLATIHP